MKKILLVEDEMDVKELLVDLIQSYGFSVQAFSNVTQAFEHFCKESCDYLLTDLIMPGETGFDLIQKIRKINPHLPILAMTGEHPSEVHQELEKSLNIQMLYKPFQVDTLLQHLKSLD